MGDVPSVLKIGSSDVEYYTSETWDEVERDPRGLLLMWEAPEKRSRYIIGMDSSEGITGWTRGTRTDKDDKTDNGAIEIFKVDGEYELVYKTVPNTNGPGVIQVPEIDPSTRRHRRLYKDVQVAEFAAPCDPVEIARIAYVLSRVYQGNSDQDHCELIWESWPGCGMLATQELLRLNHTFLWRWETFADTEAEETKAYGWHSSHTSQKMLWYRARRHLMSRQAVIKSQFLLGEYASAEIDFEKMRARAAHGYHDDRFQAANMAFWAAHKWTYDVDKPADPVMDAPEVDFQQYAPTLGDESTTFAEWRANYTDDWD